MLPARYSIPTILLHWLTVLLIAAAYASIELREVFARGSDVREAMKAWHYAIGLSIFALVWLRLLLRLVFKTPDGGMASPRWQAVAGGLAHLALYALMIALPLLGWLMLSAEGEPILWWGVELPPIAGPDEALAEQAEELHEIVGKAGYFLIGIHAIAALVHHYVLKDGVLARMLPLRRSAT